MNLQDAILLGRPGGIPVRLHVTWFLVAALLSWSLAESYLPDAAEGYGDGAYWLGAIVVALLFFASLLAHEFAHALVAQARGLKVVSITLYLFGGVAAIESEAERASDEFWITVVGPLTSFGLGGLFGLLWLAGREVSDLFGAMLGYLAIINVSLAVFNLLPGFPLDGGRLLRALVWWRTGDGERATRIAAGAGVALGYGLVLLGIVRAFTGSFTNGLWLVFVGWYLQSMAEQYRRQTATRALFSGLRVGQLTDTAPAYVRPGDTLDRVAQEIVLARGVRTLPVLEAEPEPETIPGPGGDGFLGLLTLANIVNVPRDRWATTTAAAAMVPAAQLHAVAPDDPVEDAVRLMGDRDVNQVAVLKDGRFYGLLNRSTVIRHLEIRSALPVVDGGGTTAAR